MNKNKKILFILQFIDQTKAIYVMKMNFLFQENNFNESLIFRIFTENQMKEVGGQTFEHRYPLMDL